MIGAELLAAAAMLFPGDACLSDKPEVHVAITWRSLAMPEALRVTVEREAETIWRRLGVALRWDAPADLSAAAVISVIVADENAPRANSPAQANLGWIVFHGATPSKTIYVSAPAALEMASQARTFERLMNGQPLAARRIVAARLLGRAVAHELGHYLLRSRTHTASGLMRPMFPASEAFVPLLDRYRLPPTHVALLRLGMQVPCWDR